MKKLTILSILSTILLSCTAGKQPTYLGVEDISISSISKDTVKILSRALFRNDNTLGGKVSTDGIDVFVSGSLVGKVKFKEVDVPAHREFDVPLEVSIPLNKLSGGNLLGGAINAIINKSNPQVKLRGPIKYNVAGFKASYMINKIQELKINK